MHSRIRIIVAGMAIVAAVSACGSQDAQNDNAEPTTTTQAAAAATTPETTTSEAPSGPTKADAAPNEAQAAAMVDVKDMKFSPDTVTIGVGQTVQWKFADNGIPHAVQGLDDIGMELSSPILKDADWSHTFTAPGTYKYICPLHPQMQATVIVR